MLTKFTFWENGKLTWQGETLIYTVVLGTITAVGLYLINPKLLKW